MPAQDIITIILTSLTLISLIVNAIIWTVKQNKKSSNKENDEKWMMINKLIENMINKQNSMCAEISKLKQEVADLRLELEKIKPKQRKK